MARSWKGLVTASGQDRSPEASYDPMRQFAELAGDVSDPYPLFAGIRADSPVLQVDHGAGSGRRSRLDPKAPQVLSLFTVPGAEDPHIHGLLCRSPQNLPVRFDPA